MDDKIDIHEGAYVAHMWLYIFCGLLDAMWQTTAYWFMGAMSNDPAKLANFAGFCTCLELLELYFRSRAALLFPVIARPSDAR